MKRNASKLNTNLQKQPMANILLDKEKTTDSSHILCGCHPEKHEKKEDKP